MTKLCPTSKPLIPAKIFIEFVQNIASKEIYILNRIPNSKYFIPIISLMNFGKTILVEPPYAKTRGKEATIGRINLYLHLRSNTSSLKPNNIIKQILKSAALYSNCCIMVNFMKI